MIADLKFLNYQVDKVLLDAALLDELSDSSEHYSVSFTREISVRDDKKEARVRISCSIKDGDRAEGPFLEIRVSGFFERGDGLSEDQFFKMCEKNGVATLFPFLRSSVADVTRISNMGTPIILPLLNIAKTLEAKSVLSEK